MTTRTKVPAGNGPREKQLNIRLYDEEMEWLMNVAKHYGLNGSSVLRMLLKREHDTLQGNRPPIRRGP